MIFSALVILICSSVPDENTGKPPLCDETNHIRMLRSADIPESEKFTDLQLCNMGWEIAAKMDGSSTLGKGEFVRIICRIGNHVSKPESEK